MKTIVYKVVCQKFRHGQPIKGIYTSACTHKYAVNYEVGEETLPHAGTKLFAFTNRQQAIYYRNIMGGIVFRAIAENAHSNGWFRQETWTLDEARDYFAGVKTMEKPQAIFSSSVVCDAITLVSRVHA